MKGSFAFKFAVSTKPLESYKYPCLFRKYYLSAHHPQRTLTAFSVIKILIENDQHRVLLTALKSTPSVCLSLPVSALPFFNLNA